MLLDGRVFELSFTPAPNVVTPDMTLGAPLGGLMQDQGAATGPVAIAAGSGSGLFDGGSLGALFEVRDRIVPEFDAEIDRYANDLIERFRDLMPAAALDASGDGLFVDGGAGGLTGLAGRIEINAAVDPERRRRGLAAARRARARRRPGPRATAPTCRRCRDAMAAPRDPIGFVSQNARAGGGDDGLGDRLLLRRPRRAQRRGPRLSDGAAVDAGRAGDARDRRRHRRRARSR